MTKPVAAIYARLSRDKKKGSADEGLSIAQQIKACEEFIQRQGWTQGKTYQDNDVSAKNVKFRDGFEQMLEDKPEVVIVWNQDRLERGFHDALARFFFAGLTGYESSGMPISAETASGEFQAGIKSLVSRYEVKLKAERQKLAYKRDAEANKWHYARPVFGNDRKTGKLIPDEAEAIRKSAKALAAEETTFFKVSKDWNAQGFRTPESKGAGGRHWEPGTVRNFFTAPRLIGKRVYDGKTYDMTANGWEPVLDEDTFNTIQDLINAAKTGRRGVQGSRNMPHLLTGIATCEVCGKGMNVQYRGGAGSTKAYRCTTPGHVSRVAAPLEKWVVEKFLYLLMHDGAEKVVSPDTHGSATKLRLERVEATKAHEAWLDEAVEASLSPTLIGKKVAAHTAKLAEIDARLLEVLRETSFAGLLPELASEGPAAMWKRWESVPMDKKRAVIQSLFAEIVVKKCPQGRKFRPEYIKLKATDLMLQLVDLNADAEPLPAGMLESLVPQEA
ncbi:recombinase family protein [Paenarthrobacter sp. NPDC057355]|uniref:recombinase family protein n=1 Tax=Paenarthrobacter sp. NPDC057355 TaxID=3346105 RepID=UPI00363CCA8B